MHKQTPQYTLPPQNTLKTPLPPPSNPLKPTSNQVLSTRARKEVALADVKVQVCVLLTGDGRP